MEIKFRAWNIIVKRMQYFDLPEIEKQSGKIQWHILKIDLFTGLKDKNGKEIYEGDILFYEGVTSFGEKIIRAVTFNEERSQFMSGIYPLHNDSIVKPMVIGNIYENPELLKNNTNNQLN